jgi:hypothetical protein
MCCSFLSFLSADLFSSSHLFRKVNNKMCVASDYKTFINDRTSKKAQVRDNDAKM